MKGGAQTMCRVLIARLNGSRCFLLPKLRVDFSILRKSRRLVARLRLLASAATQHTMVSPKNSSENNTTSTSMMLCVYMRELIFDVNREAERAEYRGQYTESVLCLTNYQLLPNQDVTFDPFSNEHERQSR
jgi:hypothetical protein